MVQMLILRTMNVETVLFPTAVEQIMTCILRARIKTHDGNIILCVVDFNEYRATLLFS